MNKHFSRIALVGKVEDARVADSMVALARHLRCARPRGAGRSRGVIDGRPAGRRRASGRSASSAKDADLIVAIGGDGTMLYAAQLAIGRDIPLLGVNRGRLGFLTDVSPDDMLESFDTVLQGRYETDVRKLLEARLTRAGEPVVARRALNDVVVQRHESGRMVELETWIDGQFVNTHGGDGIVIASSTGSTAYALSCGGPIIHPSLDVLVIAPISPHTLSDRPIVIGRDSRIEMRLVERSAYARAGHLRRHAARRPRRRFAARRSSRPASAITLLHPPGHDYFRLLRSKLHWGRSARSGGMEP